MNPLRSLYIDFNSFFASCEQQENPALRGKPIAVVPVMTDSTSVIAASYPAKAFGVKTGTKVGDAKRMCPGLILVPARHGVYIKYHHAVIESVDKVVPLRAVRSIDELACELTGTQRDPERARELALKVKKQLAADIGPALTCSIGIAPNFLIAKIAADLKKPDGLTIIEQHRLPELWDRLKLQDIPGIGAKMEARLWAKNIKTVRQLAEQKEAQARGAWGSVVGSEYHYLLHGGWMDFDEPDDPKSISHQHVLPPKERNWTDSLAVSQRLLSKAALRMRQGGFRARRLAFNARLLPYEKFQVEVKFHETGDTTFLMKELKRLYEKLPRDAKPIRVGVVLSDFRDEDQHQISFFEDPKRELAMSAMDKINAKFGKDTLYVGSLHEHLKSAPTRIAFSRVPGLDEIEDEED